MTNLKNFILSLKNKDDKLPVPTIAKINLEISVIPSIYSLEISNSDKENFSNMVADMTNSKEFINELSNKIENPKNNESEDEFVIRAKEIMKKLLKDNLKRK